MSRIGKRPVAVPSGITANVAGQTVKVKGPKGALEVKLHDDVLVKLEEGRIKIDPRNESKRARSQRFMARMRRTISRSTAARSAASARSKIRRPRSILVLLGSARTASAGIGSSKRCAASYQCAPRAHR